ncbi:MAG TPA: hypothetical protein VGJ29_08720 [Vicinamibacterales bacterium]|jgi:hypothetical protein
MPDQDVDALIDRIVAGARIPSRAERDDLRRELQTHFEEGTTSPDLAGFAIRRFGPEALITESLRRVYWWDYLAAHVARLVASTIASFAAALVILALVNLRVEIQTEVWRLTPGFSRAAGVALAVVLGLVAVQEAIRRPFSAARALLALGAYAAICGVMQTLVAHSAEAFVVATVFVALGYMCSKLPSRPLRWMMTFVLFAATEYAIHARLAINFAPSRAAVASAALVAVWGSTILILTRIDRAFAQKFDSAAN